MALQYMTQEGLDKLKKELAEAIAQRPVISAAIAEARDKGDLSENAGRRERHRDCLNSRSQSSRISLQMRVWSMNLRSVQTRCRCSTR